MIADLKNIQSTVKLVFSILICQIIGIASVLFSQTGSNYWYESYVLKSWNISIYTFGAIWVLLYFLVGTSFWLIWISNTHHKTKSQALQTLIIQLILNFLWFLLFFKFHYQVFSFLLITIILLLIITSLIQTFKISKIVVYLLIPYFFWILYEVILNIRILILFYSYQD
ncbi:TspO/MBR family protein [Flavobacterium sp.]|uniref:TspO/MBR family protein n=1 Tax=Flavobacterium sp. TaxID=239 RepID=UPI0038D3630F